MPTSCWAAWRAAPDWAAASPSIPRARGQRWPGLSLGGAGPMHALALAEEMGIRRVLVPRHPGNFSALGLLASDIKHDDVRTRVGPLRERLPMLAQLFAEMEDTAARQLEI